MAERDETRDRPERPGFKDIYDAVDRVEEKMDSRFEKHEERVDKTFATKADVRLWVVGGLIGGQTVAATVTAFVTHLGPTAQAAALYARIKGVL